MWRGDEREHEVEHKCEGEGEGEDENEGEGEGEGLFDLCYWQIRTYKIGRAHV